MGSSAAGGSAVARLTALWALAEVGLGGALHAFRLPVTGLVVGSSAVLLLALLAEAARREGRPVGRTLLGATAVVLGVKLAASPHSPVGAYVAVAFQGGLAALVLPGLGRRFGPVMLGAVALAESAVQRVLVLTVLFGTALWEAVDALVAQVLRQLGALGLPAGGDGSASLWLVGGYVGVHVVVGLAVGVLGARLPARVFADSAEAGALARAARASVADRAVGASGRRRPWYARPAVRRFALAVGLLALYAVTGARDGSGTAETAVRAVVRAVAIVGLWVTVVAPLALRLIRRLGRSGGRGAAEAAAQLPELAALARLAWRRTAGAGLRRPIRFAALVASATIASAAEIRTPEVDTTEDVPSPTPPLAPSS